MKKLSLRIFLFIAPVALLVLLMPINRRTKFAGLKDDCFNHGIWIYDRLHKNPKPVDLAFFGSSHTINGINDELIQDSLSKHSINVANLGYCRLGRNLTYTFVKELLITKKPKIIIIEVLDDEDRYSHPIFPNVGYFSDVTFPALLFNRDIFSDWKEASMYNLQLIQKKLYFHHDSAAVSENPFGFASSTTFADPENLENAKKRKSINNKALEPLMRDFYMLYPRYYLNKIQHLCDQNFVKLYFLYLPSFGSCEKLPAEINTYRTMGKVLLPPCELLNNKSFWADELHLNKIGGNAFSKWVAKEIENEVKR